jgi:chromate transporter
MDTSQKIASTSAKTSEPVHYTLWQLVRYFLRLGTLGFGGPVALVGYMQRDLVEQRGWIAEADYKEGLALARLSPGPLAAQLAMYLGYVRYRIPGATLVGLAFIWPSFLMVVALGWLYTIYGGLTWMQAVFYGVGASVIGIVAVSALKLTNRTIGRDPLLWGIYLVMAALFAAVATTGGTLWALFSFFAIAGAFVFGSGLAIIPFLFGAITGAVIVLGRRTITDIPTIALALVTLVLLWRWKKIPEPFVVLGAAIIGLIVFALLHQ